jgi:pyridoxamine 5'-phosphate oxidase
MVCYLVSYLIRKQNSGAYSMISKEILSRFNHLQTEVKDCDSSAMTLASVDERCRPTQRIITLLLIDPQGLVFFTNRNSRKGQHYAVNPHASACFFWQSLKQQVEFDGTIEPVEESVADAIWQTRDRDSQIGSWASNQSQPLENKQQLLARVVDVKNRYRDILIPRAPDWLAYRLVPDRVEFWKSGWHRLHERVCYELKNETWHRKLLEP